MSKKFDRILKAVALQNRVPVETVKQEMQKAHNEAWENPTPLLLRAFPNGKPTLEEFVFAMADRIGKER